MKIAKHFSKISLKENEKIGFVTCHANEIDKITHLREQGGTFAKHTVWHAKQFFVEIFQRTDFRWLAYDEIMVVKLCSRAKAR